jgi:DmsE family decaheme c-type cytochrome
MISRPAIALVSMVALLSLASIARSQQNPYRLKEPDEKKLCITCHTDFEQKLKNRFVHTPVRSGECSGCHDPHVSAHGKLLSADPNQICAGCHDSVITKDAKSAHKPVADGQCSTCHDPHASENSANLKAKGSDLCFTCHKELGDSVRKARFKHSPVEQGCSTCHAAHASNESVRLLKTAVPAVCLNCHKPDTPSFQARHMKYPVGQASCTSCHDPHGSNQAALLLDNVHAPLSGGGGCTQCHEPPDSPTPFATKQRGFELCKGCHADMVNTTMAKRQLHWPAVDQRGCVNCHNPHASKQEKLLKAATPQLCTSCHADTMKRIGGIAVKHAPVDGGTCVACHSPHGSNGVYFLNQDSVIKTCTACHDYATHSAHPIGDKAIDPRNKNLQVDCLSCHKGHGTEFKHMLLAETNVELCTQCHKQYAR